jgi:putative membrane protein
MSEHDTEDLSRNDLAEDRTILANERTFAGWVRTALACIALGIGFHALFQKLEPAWLPRGIATAFLLLAILLVALAEWRAAAVTKRLSTHIVSTARPMNLRIIAGIVALGAAALIGAIWLIDIG